MISKHQIVIELQKTIALSAVFPILVIFRSTFEWTFCEKNVVRRRDGSDKIVGPVFTLNRERLSPKNLKDTKFRIVKFYIS